MTQPGSRKAAVSDGLQDAFFHAADPLWEGLRQHLDRDSRRSLRLSSKQLQLWVDTHLSSLTFNHKLKSLPSLQRFERLHTLWFAQSQDLQLHQLLADQEGLLTSIQVLKLCRFATTFCPVDIKCCTQLFPCLTSLEFSASWNQQWSPCAAVASLTGLSQLAKLIVQVSVEPEAWTSLVSLTSLSCLDSGSTDPSVLSLTQLTALSLTVNAAAPLFSAVQAGTHGLAQLHRLVVLDMPAVVVNNPILAQLASLTCLRQLQVGDFTTTDDADSYARHGGSSGRNDGGDHGSGGRGPMLHCTSLQIEEVRSERLPVLQSATALRVLHIQLANNHAWQLPQFVQDAVHVEKIHIRPILYRHPDNLSTLAGLPGLHSLGLDCTDAPGLSVSNMSYLTQLTQLEVIVGSPALHNSIMSLGCLSRLRELELNFDYIWEDVEDDDQDQPPFSTAAIVIGLLLRSHLTQLIIEYSAYDSLFKCEQFVNELLQEAGSDWAKQGNGWIRKVKPASLVHGRDG